MFHFQKQLYNCQVPLQRKYISFLVPTLDMEAEVNAVYI